jgi:ABC-type antimicrobial peptide transport system permease subunit
MVTPPLGDAEFSTYGVSAEDMAYLVDLYGLELKEGHLPRLRTNEIVIPEAAAQNRKLKIGDVIGNPNQPAYEQAPKLPTEFVISGIFAAPGNEAWLSFASLEFIQSHEAFSDRSLSFIVVPQVGQKETLDDWLENELANAQINVLTHRHVMGEIQSMKRNIIQTLALLESVIVIVGAVALAVLNYLFVSQRQAEFGVLYALGFSRLQLVWRTLRETIFTTTTAWGLSIVLILIGVLFQFALFKSLGLSLDLFNPVPWLFTLPVPIAVLIVSAGTITWTLSTLDPVSIIERRG